jgi:translation initiation factor IF-1
MENRMKKSHSGLLVLAALCALPVAAHHSGAMYESTRTQTITGKVTEFNWVNPHSSIKVEVTGTDGKAEIWLVEMNTPQNLVRSGWKRTTIKPGDEVTVTLRPMRNGQPGGSYVSIKLADGTVLDGAPAE